LVRLDVLQQETRRLTSLLDDVLQFVRRPELNPRIININNLAVFIPYSHKVMPICILWNVA